VYLDGKTEARREAVDLEGSPDAVLGIWLDSIQARIEEQKRRDAEAEAQAGDAE